MINNSEFHSPKEFKIFSFSEFHSLQNELYPPLNKGINGFLKSILKYNKSFFILKRKIKVNKYK